MTHRYPPPLSLEELGLVPRARRHGGALGTTCLR
jgi:hypothetical protein